MPDTAIGPRPGLSNVADIIIAPRAAFSRIRQVPTWGWALLAASVLGIAGSLLALPASMHALDVSGPALYGANPAVTQLPADKQAEMVQRMISFGRIGIEIQSFMIPVFILIGGLFSALVMLIANAISRGDGTFKRYFALAITVAVVSSIGLLLNGVIAMVRGPGGYESIQSVQGSVPSLALLAPSAGKKLAAFLAALNIVTIWATALTALGMVAVGRVKPPVAWVAAILMLLAGASIVSMFVQ
jgi:Yip1-like protein